MTRGELQAAVLAGILAAAAYFGRKDIERAMDNSDRLPTDQAVSIIRGIRENYPFVSDLPVSLVMAVIETESNFRIHAKSTATEPAIGLMQTKLPTFQWMVDLYLNRGWGKPGLEDVNPYNPYWNIWAGMHYLKRQINATGSIRDGLHAYYHGLGGWKSGSRNNGYVALILERQSRWVFAA